MLTRAIVTTLYAPHPTALPPHARIPPLPMKIAVCIKRTGRHGVAIQDRRGRRVGGRGRAQVRHHDFDGYAVEVGAAAQWRSRGRGETVVISLGPNLVQETLRKAMSMGIDRAIHLKADARPVRRPGDRAARWPPSSRAGATISCCSGACRSTRPVRRSSARRRPNCSACRASLRRRSSRSPARVARPDASSKAQPSCVEFPLPAVVTIDEGIARPRYPSLKGIMAAKKKPLESEAGAARRRAT